MGKYLTLEDIEDIKKDIQKRIAKYNIENSVGFTFDEHKEWGEAENPVMGQSIFHLKFITFGVLFKNWQSAFTFTFKLDDEQHEIYTIHSWPNLSGTAYKEYFDSLINRYDRTTGKFRIYKKAKPTAVALTDVEGIENELTFSGPSVEAFEGSDIAILHKILESHETLPNIAGVRGNDLIIRLPIDTIIDHFYATTQKKKPMMIRPGADKKFAKALAAQLAKNERNIDVIEYILIRLYNDLIDHEDKTLIKEEG